MPLIRGHSGTLAQATVLVLARRLKLVLRIDRRGSPKEPSKLVVLDRQGSSRLALLFGERVLVLVVGGLPPAP